ncbi:AraC family transcriptional regulator [Pseudonocardia sp. N23]|uniref:AraC family transcriptional regulator n=1 Tax=Pseudonocardia sp. N23 TaxID=1987376 RepID=UPI000BFE7E54|nr:AraC family transcriptional regulator [Pseudonocardia sp. N23]
MTDPAAARLAHPDGSSSDDTTRSRTAHHLVDIDEARLVGSRLYYPQKLTVLDHAPAFTMSVQAARIGSVLLGELRYDADVRIDCGELGDSYHVNVPLHGRLASRHDGQESVASPGHAALYGPLGETVLTRWEAGSRQLCVKIDRAAFETTLSRHVGRDIVGPISVEPVLDVGGGAGRSWVELALMLNEQLHRPDSIVHQPLVAGSLANGLLSGLITAAGLEHRVQDAVRSSPTVRPRTIELALAYLNEHAGDPIGIADVAGHSCVSVRTLQEGFARYVGQSPMQYLRSVRLHLAHEALLAANPYDTTVASIAHSWGFNHLGRFAAIHEAEFGEPPSQTLHRG